MNDLIVQIFFFLVIIPSAILHEYMHGWAANQLGDPTAKYLGRLTLNPKSHIDPIGSLLLPAALFLLTSGQFLFAYAKPVPYNPRNLSNQKWGPPLVAAAGPLTNLVLALVFGVFTRLILSFEVIQLYEMIPFFIVIVQANVLLLVFNLVPIPPLDGSKILYALLPPSLTHIYHTLERYGFIILIFFIFFLFDYLYPIMGLLISLFTGIR